jgi:formate-dependent nitrite reductase membrane component NrfD
MSAGLPLAEAPWGATIGIYLVLVGLASGLTLVSWWVRPEEPRTAARFDWIAAWTALLLMLIVSALLVADLGRPARFFLMVTRFENLDSPMSIGAKLIAAEIGLLGVHLYLIRRRLSALARGDASVAAGLTLLVYSIAPAALALVSFALAIYPAALLSFTWISPLATGSMASVVFLSTAIVMGAAAARLIGSVPREEAFERQLARTLGFAVCANLAALVFQVAALPSTERALLGHDVWMLVALLLSPLPVILVRHRTAMMLGTLVALAGAGLTRYLVFAIR